MSQATLTQLPSAPEDGARGVWGLRVLHGPTDVGRMEALGEGLVLGREEGRMVLDDPRMSRRHAEVVRRGPVFGIRDLGSKNGTRVDGTEVRSRSLREGALIRVGDTLLGFERLQTGHVEGDVIGRSRAVVEALRSLDEVAPSHLPVLVLGETGTGKELAARRVHAASGRRGPLVPLNCGAIPEGLAESTLFGHRKGAFTGADREAEGLARRAHGGTLFLDEVGELPLPLQPKLLRALESGEVLPVGASKPEEVDLRVVAATNADLERMVAQGTFRADLHARLAGVVVRLPALSDRKLDVPALARHFVDRELSTDLVEALCLRPWPRNVRQLRTTLERAALSTSSVLDVHHLREDASPVRSDRPTASELESLLRRHAGSVAAVARELGVHRKQVYRWAAREGLEPKDFR